METSAQPRFDLYVAIHKALRLAMTDTLARVGSLDAGDAGSRHDAVTAVRSLLDLCRSHVDKENRYVHPLIEARCPGVTGRIAGEHEHHVEEIDALEAATVAFQCAPDAASAFRLYRRLAVFVADNLMHMDVEETVHNPALWATYSDDELMRVEQAIVASIEPADMGTVLHWMLPALNAQERTAMLGGMRAGAPAPVFDGVLQLARQRLPAGEWTKLEHALGLPTAPAREAVAA